MYERFSDRARKVMQLANAEVHRSGSDYILAEHILLAMLREGTGVGTQVLTNLRVDLARLKSEIERLSPSPPAPPAPVLEPPPRTPTSRFKRFLAGLLADSPRAGRVPMNVRAKKVIEYAMEEARLLKHGYIGTEHLLLGLLDEHDSPPAQVLNALGVRWEALREETARVLQ
ncbi:MAG TPA: Clp protease N-terminal domain-containing protein, partial [Planctomycetaceae bacterium]|nr:Clp protease N-terminal domain-containing protein [Planctomycetaceae bacterium]